MEKTKLLLEWRYNEATVLRNSLTRLRVESGVTAFIGIQIVSILVPICWWLFLIPLCLIVIPTLPLLFWPVITKGKQIKEEDKNKNEKELAEKMLQSIEEDIVSLRSGIETLKRIRRWSIPGILSPIQAWKGGVKNGRNRATNSQR